MPSSQDSQHLQLLSIFHYVAAGLHALLSLIPIFHLAFGVMMITGQFDNGEQPPAVMGWMFIVVAGIECIFMPVGTVLGIFTIIVLVRPAVREMFGVAASD